jgi:hypothetical protein
MHTVVETPSYLAAAKASGMSEATRLEIVRNPSAGDLSQGTHGLRKLRHARPGGGKSGGYRVITFYRSPGLPVFLITVFGKNEKANLSRAEASALGEMVKAMAANYGKKEKR